MSHFSFHERIRRQSEIRIPQGRDCGRSQTYWTFRRAVLSPDNKGSKFPAMSVPPYAISRCHVQENINVCCHKSNSSFCGLYPFLVSQSLK